MKSPLATQIPEVPLKHSISPVFPSPGSNPILPTGLTSPFSYAAQLSQLSQLSQPLPGAFPSPLTHIPQRPAYYPSPILYWYPSPPVSPQSYYTQAQTGPAVVVMRGLPFNASIQDILAFFQSYPEVSSEFSIFCLANNNVTQFIKRQNIKTIAPSRKFYLCSERYGLSSSKIVLFLNAINVNRLEMICGH